MEPDCRSPAQKIADSLRALRQSHEDADLFFNRIEHLAGEGLRKGELTKQEVQSLCGSLLEHVRTYREKTGIFSSLKNR